MGGVGRMSWDPIAVLLAVRGPAAAHCVEHGGGYNTVSENGDETWVGRLDPVLKPHNASFNQTRVRFGDFQGGDPRQALGRELDLLLCRSPGERLGSTARPNLVRWARLPGANCRVSGVGAGNASAAPPPAAGDTLGRQMHAKVRSVEACQRRCMLEPMCEAVTVLGPSIHKLYSCHLLAEVQLD